ncbi:metal-dependent hydrolase [Nocardia sp. NPDC052001]|uniref:metal-dependent hydrolase n=1 Tax=Nocardia sp. NPDC052001 TaxID=3154853 RepID=UPI0034296044
MATKKAAAPQPYREEAHAIHARDVKFDWDDVPLHYLPGEPFATHFWNVMHLVVPVGEKAMAGTLAEALPYIDDERLREEAVGFIGQEAMHASSHEGLHDRFREQGLDIEPALRNWVYVFRGVVSGLGLDKRMSKAWLNERLALFSAAEHFTAVIGQWLLDNEEFAKAGMHPAVLDLLKWHGAEEVEHRNVMFDVFEHVDGSYARRVRTALFVSPAGLALWVLVMRELLKKDPSPDKGRAWPIQWISATAKGLIPGPSFLVREIPPYLRRGFHPSEMGSLDAALKYLATSPAALAAE